MWMTALLLLCAVAAASAQNRVLFIGNSFTYGSGDGRAQAAGGVPGIFDALAIAGGHADPVTQMQTTGGVDFEYHVGNAATQNAISSDQWTHVILQNHSTEPTHLSSGSVDDHFSFGTKLYEQVLANNPATEVVLYETFARAEVHALITGTSGPNSFASTAEFQEEIRTQYRALADALTAGHPGLPLVQVAPVGSAWESAGGLLASNAEGYRSLHSSGDDYHGNDNGYYLAAAVFYAKIYGESPQGLSMSSQVQALNLQLTEDAAALETVAWGIVGPRIAQLEAGQVMLIDFGAEASTMDEGDDELITWNNVTPAAGGTDDGVVAGLLTSTGAATDVGIEMISRFNGANTSGSAVSSAYPGDATSDSLYGNTEAFGGLSDVFPSFKVTGLNPAIVYSLTFYASRGGVGDNRETKFTVTGTDEEVANFDAANNVDNTATLEGIGPAADGTITVAISPGQNNTNGNHFTYLGVMQIDGPALPTTELLFDLGAAGGQMEEGDDESGKSWNNLTPEIGNTSDGVLADIVTSSGQSTGIGLTMVSRFGGANTTGTTTSEIFPVNAASDSFYANTEAFGGQENLMPSFTLTGLDPSQPHVFTFFGSRANVGDNRETRFTAMGANSGTAAIDAANNEAEVANVTGILPTAAGEITIAVTAGENNDNTNHFTYFGIMKVAYAGAGAPDTTAPELKSVKASGTLITVVFDEPVDVTSAETIANYSVTADGTPVQLDGAEVEPDGVTVLIELVDALIGPFTLTVTGVTDVSGNTIVANSSINGVAADPDAEFFLFDFGGGEFIEEDENGNFWNNVTTGVANTDDGELFDVFDGKGDSTDVSLVMIRRFNGVNNAGTRDNPNFPEEATVDSYYANTEEFGGLSNVFPAFKFTGLDPLKVYTFTFFASRPGVGDNRETGYTLTGANAGFAALNVANNIEENAVADAIVPTADGEVTIEVGPTENNDNGNHFTYLGVVRIDVGEPVAGLTITTQPANVTVDELDAASFSVAIEGEPPFTVQWSRNGSAIEGATEFVYMIDNPTAALTGSTFTATITNASGSVTSDPATLTIIPDQAGPTLSGGSSNGTIVTLIFGEILDKASAETATNYTVTGSSVAAAVLDPNGVTLRLTLGTPIEGDFTVAVNGVTDRVGNTIATDTTLMAKAPIAGRPTFYFDFGGGGTTADDDPTRSWNSVTTAIAADEFGELFDIVDSVGGADDMTLAMISRFNGTNTNGYREHPDFPASATGDSLYGNTAAFNGLTDVLPSFKLANLDAGLAYTLTLYASRLNVGDTRETGFTVKGESEIFGALEPANNELGTLVIGPVVPDANGEITISIGPTENNLNGNEFTYLGLMVVETSLPVGGGEFSITLIARGDDGSVTLTWNSVADASYAIETSTDAVVWDEAEDGVIAEGETTMYVDQSPASATELYYRVKRE
ncbi:MAG: hypothetical protein ACI9R3_005650 [Verrucomicrobiales bacterium]|jgi:hypothetical protein